MAVDLPPTVRKKMVAFVQEELLMEKWMRAQSMRSLQLSAADLEI
jgi:hypothetical protein